MIPGEFKLGKGEIECNVGYDAMTVKVKNIGDRAVQVGSQFHFYEANEEGLKFERSKAYGKKLDIPSGTAIRFEPGEEKEVKLIDFGGKRRVYGFNNRIDGYLDTDQHLAEVKTEEVNK